MVFGGGEDVGDVVVVIHDRVSGAVFLRGAEERGVAAEGLALVDPRAHLIQKVLLLGNGSFFELRDLADGVSKTAFETHGSLREAAAERRLLDGGPVA